MYLQLVRESFNNKATEGKLFVNGEFQCYTLEDMDRFLEEGGEKVYGLTAVPRGVYPVELTYSNRFKIILPLIKDVPGFSGVRIHIGNSSKDTEGCILVGHSNRSDTDDFVEQSRVAMNALMVLLREATNRGEQITLEIV